MTTKINTLQEALTAIAETAYKINGSTVLTSEHCAALTGALYNSQQREDALTKTRDEALRDLAECTAQLRDTSKQLDESIAASMTSAQERTELEARIAELDEQVSTEQERTATEGHFKEEAYKIMQERKARIDALEAKLGEVELLRIAEHRDLAAARKALEPFANEAQLIPQNWPDSMRMAVTTGSLSGFSIGDLRAAARAEHSDGGKGASE